MDSSALSPRQRLVPLTRAIAALALTGLLAGLGAAVLGYVALRTLQDILGIPAVAPPICSVLGAVGGCRVAFRLVPPGWFPGEQGSSDAGRALNGGRAPR